MALPITFPFTSKIREHILQSGQRRVCVHELLAEETTYRLITRSLLRTDKPGKVVHESYGSQNGIATECWRREDLMVHDKKGSENVSERQQRQQIVPAWRSICATVCAGGVAAESVSFI